jgi:hypothetical protein
MPNAYMIKMLSEFTIQKLPSQVIMEFKYFVASIFLNN